MPTWTGQGDLRFAIHAAQDEFPRVVLTPGDQFEAFALTKKAFVLAEKYQLPVIILVDKYLCESHKSGLPFTTQHQNQRYGFVSDPIPPGFEHYALSDSGVSPRPYLGQSGGAGLIANSYEHGSQGFASEDPGERQKMNQKRMRKFEALISDLWPLPMFGNRQAPTTLLGFGSSLGPVLEALKQLPEVNYLHFNYVWPFPSAQVKETLGKAKRIICLEENALGQLQGLVREYTGIEIKESLRKYDGRPFYPEEIIAFLGKEKRNF
ncbi:hypothetical protein A2160_04995 [Candidatus Beckwithbacteria bacterium RBG_13_42_9]|uniref:Pyruvate flavodoxin/ferredoxin oxidoreductase pyrimidine binding domain-containing protein n=1 Tax=Candidatus Beckwithbacteria bacterium RBG_13_42_9 TaxID=1797457 RepID=A0A1F5E5F4_9BACT|nr:MAG: hypothetical protein A2160_04995 [Candidatus Beckwithbacteria bacterium RBG_13_42_9]